MPDQAAFKASITERRVGAEWSDGSLTVMAVHIRKFWVGQWPGGGGGRSLAPQQRVLCLT